MLTATILQDDFEAIVAPPTTLKSHELLRVEPDGIEIHATDKSREAIVEVSASEAAFNSYSAEPMETGINLSQVAQFLNIVGETDLIQIEINAEQSWITLTAGSLTYTFSLVGSNTVPIVFTPLDADQPAMATLPSRKLDVPIELADIAGSQIRLRVDSNPTTFSGTTNNMRDAFNFEFGAADVERVQGSAVGQPVSLDYFAPIQRVIPADTLMRWELGNREHVRLQYPIANGTGTVTATFAGIGV
ncbi:beta clamp domain-containing protein [Natronobacterium gregoryi]|uniref:DNA polymerase sliding clamp n=2 Tax=Natronobacterium gregoryi TaxID=44930 RepID=L0AIU0_NATGS|nr:hypothetical protein [Natronobacterium gregoryi]AFZ73808.1 Proliferating cell nuclear antigen, N-terminal domain protein [Natronobacterium gregoryi SP2]ELY65295.1 DNA polymerase sliding clamp [Natronobacterium gregoryi SP2]PLK19229.1 hypothetical protein CYV19_16030 [Natronobacterium gregoryi SP2]SFJ56931.1 proliferating cell antigen [Natronobacterium gregoryi]